MLAKRRCLNSWPRRTSRISRLHKDSISSRCNRKASNWTCGILAGNEKLGLIGEIISRFVVISTLNLSASKNFSLSNFSKNGENSILHKNSWKCVCEGCLQLWFHEQKLRKYKKKKIAKMQRFCAYNFDFTRKKWRKLKIAKKSCKCWKWDIFDDFFILFFKISSFFRWLIE